jgi:hypothetical protein
MSGKATRPSVVVSVNQSQATLPSYIRSAQRHLEKGNFEALAVGEYSVPTDLLRLTLPTHLVDEIKEIRLVYRRKAPTA